MYVLLESMEHLFKRKEEAVVNLQTALKQCRKSELFGSHIQQQVIVCHTLVHSTILELGLINCDKEVETKRIKNTWMKAKTIKVHSITFALHSEIPRTMHLLAFLCDLQFCMWKTFVIAARRLC